ncbi:MAG: WD40/YVTN/BNR-like repeat-containing protein, partial [Actinomycetes bacterium]
GYLVLRDGTVLRTDNNGDTFSQKTAVPGTSAAGGSAFPGDVVFTSLTTGFVARHDGRLFRTTDGANSWTEAISDGPRIRGLYFLDEDTGFAVGDGSAVYGTLDGGTAWEGRTTSGVPGLPFTGISCATKDLCVITTEPGGAIVRTKDAGFSGTLVTPSQDPIHAAAFASAGKVVAAGALGATAVSEDAGKTYSPVSRRLSGSYFKVRAGQEPGTAYAPGAGGSLARTADGGKTWVRGNVSTSEDVRDVSFPTAEAGLALDVAGGLFRTEDGGQTWRSLDTGTTAAPAAVEAIDRSIVLLAGPRGVRRSTDAGDTFDAISARRVARATLTGIDRAGARTVVAYGRRAILRSTNAGASWRAIRRPGATRKSKGKDVLRVDFVGARAGFALTTDRVLWRTRDGGRRWTPLPAVGTSDAYGMSFSSMKEGYLVSGRFGGLPLDNAGFLLRTTDGGRTFHPEFIVSTAIPAEGVASQAGGTDYLLGGRASFLYTTTGGEAGGPSTLTIRTERRRLRRARGITVTGRLNPASGGEMVTVSRLAG